jgi:RimJ/RimL family protein N-acetyltransferase
MAGQVAGRICRSFESRQSVSTTTIEELTQPHFDLVAGWLSNREINRWLTAEWRDKTTTSVLLAMMIRNKKNRVFLVYWNGRPVGLTALADIDVVDATAMVWYFLGDPTLAGKGIVSSAVMQMAKKCFQELNLKSLYAWAMENNLASTKVLEKAGFRKAGKLRQAACSNGEQVDRIYFDLLASEAAV